MKDGSSPRASLRRPLLLALLVAVAIAPRLSTLPRQGLWADELFSLAMATGHSLEHPATLAEPMRGDYVEHPAPQPVGVYRGYLEHASPWDGRSVTRAVFLSDTNPPLYYLLLDAWTRGLGTGDMALRLFSLLWALACLPLIWSLAKQIGGRSSAWIACVLFALAPAAILHSTEGRMYSLLWFLVLLNAWAALRLHRHGRSLPFLALWTLSSAAGLLTHYFFVFVWFGIGLWLLWQPGRLERRWAALAAVGASALVLPWYLLLPESLGAWRVTQNWLAAEPSGYRALRAPFALAWSFFSTEPSAAAKIGKRYLVLMLVLAAVVLSRLDWSRRGRRSLLPLLWLIGACTGPVAVDLLRDTHASAISRYALAGLPAAFLLLAAALARTPTLVRGAVLGLLLLAWIPAIGDLHAESGRGGTSMREAARYIAERSRASDVILVQSSPSGVLGVARYADGDAPIASWVFQLGQRRIPEDLAALTDGYRRIFLVTHVYAGPLPPEEQYLRTSATIVEERQFRSRRVALLVPREGEVFAYGASGPSAEHATSSVGGKPTIEVGGARLAEQLAATEGHP